MQRQDTRMIDQPFFDRWRAKLIATIEPERVGALDSIRFAQVDASVAVVCPFLRFDGEPCEQLITYYLQVGSGVEDDLSYALGACHRHLGHAFDVLYEADRIGLADACDDDAVDASAPALPAHPPTLVADTELANRLISGGIATAVDFGTTALHEGYPIVSGARITLAAGVVERLRASGVLEVAADLGIDLVTDERGEVAFVSAAPESAEEWISQNCALRELALDILEDNVDPIGYRYRTIADALPQLVAFEPRVYTNTRTGALEVHARIAATPPERTWEPDVTAERHPTLHLHLDRLPRPGDYLDVNFGLYRFVAVTADSGGFYRADTVLERVKQPSRN